MHDDVNAALMRCGDVLNLVAGDEDVALGVDRDAARLVVDWPSTDRQLTAAAAAAAACRQPLNALGDVVGNVEQAQVRARRQVLDAATVGHVETPQQPVIAAAVVVDSGGVVDLDLVAVFLS